MTMKLSIKEDSSRRIATRENNSHVFNGIDKHRPTAIAPDSLFSSLSQEIIQKRDSLSLSLERSLSGVLGTPFYADAGFILYNGDCADILKTLIAKSFYFDLTLTSPPYNIGKEYESVIDVNSYIDWCRQWMNSIFLATKPNGAFWLNVGYIEIPEKGLCVPISYLLWDKSPFYMLQEIVWSYGAGVSTKHRLSPRNEKWIFYVKNQDDYTFNLDDIRDPNVKYPNQKKNGKYRCNPLGKNPSDVWAFPKVTTGTNRGSRERTGHPAQFPLGIVERIVNASSNAAEVILDPFAGSCSAGIAAYGRGRVFVGIEISDRYCDIAVRRFEEFKKEAHLAQSQQQLF